MRDRKKGDKERKKENGIYRSVVGACEKVSEICTSSQIEWIHTLALWRSDCDLLC